MRPLIAGNWKMNGLGASLEEFERLKTLLDEAGPVDCNVLLCPPSTLLHRAATMCQETMIVLGGQDCHPEVSGAYTGDVSAEMLADAGATYVIVGHSERRADHAETDELVQRKAKAAIDAGLTPVICVGETEAERAEGRANQVVGAQVQNSLPAYEGQGIVVAYEPVWAIGTGKTATTEDIADMHAHIRGILVGMLGTQGEAARILYGGSVKPGNAGEILAVRNVDGALVGGASLVAEDFFSIIMAA